MMATELEKVFLEMEFIEIEENGSNVTPIVEVQAEMFCTSPLNQSKMRTGEFTTLACLGQETHICAFSM